MSSNNPTSEQRSRALRWIGLLCDASIAPEQLTQLEQLVVRFPQIRRNYVELMSLHADMRQQAALLRPQDSTDSSATNAIVDLVTRQKKQSQFAPAKADTDSSAPDANLDADLNESIILPAIKIDAWEAVEQDPAIHLPSNIASQPVRKRLAWRMVAGLLLPLITLTIFWALRGRSGPKPTVGPGSHPSLIPIRLCNIELAINAKWSNPYDSTLIAGSTINPGIHDLETGIVKLELTGNAMVVIEAPARFELLSNNKVRLMEGQLCAKLIKGGGLTVLTPDLTAVDLGTEFGLDVAAGQQTHLEVFQGAVRAAAANTASSDAGRSVVAGEAVMVTTGSSAIEQDTPRPLAFLRPSELQSGDGIYQRWARFSQAIREDPNLTAYYPFDSESASANRLENRAKQTAGNYDGVMGAAGVAASDPQWIEGRWPGKPALQFGGGRLKAVTINARPSLIPKTAMTLCCWIKRADVGKPFHLLAGEAESDHSFDLGMLRRADTGKVDLINLTWAHVDKAPSPVAFQANQWKFLAVSSTVEKTEFYLDGQLIVTNTLPSFAPVAVNQLWVGAPASGNNLSYPGDYFNGSMDELFIFRRALSGKEIKHLFQIGSPD
jgi:hypothetical protein